MAPVDELPDGAKVAFDASSIIYYVEEHEQFHAVVEPVFLKIAAQDATAHLSFVTLMEILVGPLRDRHIELANRYRDVLSDDIDFALHPVDRLIAERAASIRAQLRLRTPDAIVAASALESGCSHLVTNNPVFRREDGVRILVISDFAQ